jgi:hypothetical protein
MFRLFWSALFMRHAAHQRSEFLRSLPRRALAAGGLLYLLVLLCAPLLLSAAQESSLPACCRRAGAHHCAMTAGTASSSEAAVSATSHCPSWPRGFAFAHMQAYAPRPASGLAGLLLLGASLRCRNDALSRIARLRQLSLRGPPALAIS